MHWPPGGRRLMQELPPGPRPQARQGGCQREPPIAPPFAPQREVTGGWAIGEWGWHQPPTAPQEWVAQDRPRQVPVGAP